MSSISIYRNVCSIKKKNIIERLKNHFLTFVQRYHFVFPLPPRNENYSTTKNMFFFSVSRPYTTYECVMISIFHFIIFFIIEKGGKNRRRECIYHRLSHRFPPPSPPIPSHMVKIPKFTLPTPPPVPPFIY